MAVLVAVAPQMACFMPDPMLSQAEMDCCQQMAGDCSSSADMSHACCRTVVRTDIVAAVGVRHHVTQLDVAAIAVEASAPPILNAWRELPLRADHSAPPERGPSSVVLRI